MKKIFEFLSQLIVTPQFWLSALILLSISIVKLSLDRKEINRIEKKKFMEQCMQDRKEYECTYLWRSSRSQDTSVISMPVAVPVIVK